MDSAQSAPYGQPGASQQQQPVSPGGTSSALPPPGYNAAICTFGLSSTRANPYLLLPNPRSVLVPWYRETLTEQCLLTLALSPMRVQPATMGPKAPTRRLKARTHHSKATTHRPTASTPRAATRRRTPTTRRRRHSRCHRHSRRPTVATSTTSLRRASRCTSPRPPRPPSSPFRAAASSACVRSPQRSRVRSLACANGY